MSTDVHSKDAGQRRLVVVSNRLPVTLKHSQEGGWQVKPASGGLVTALLPVLERVGGVWVGWPGAVTARRAGLKRRLRETTECARYDYAPVTLTQKEIDGYYDGFSNEILWPLFHDWASVTSVFDPAHWQSYVSVNRKFARETAKLAGPGDFIWVHDYHLMNVGSELRSLGVESRIGFFLHVPFPAPDMFSKLPWRDELLRALSRFDRIGFQTARDRNNFVDCARRLFSDEDARDRLVDWELTSDDATVRIRMDNTWSGRRKCGDRPHTHVVHAGSFPISIDYGRFADRAGSPNVDKLVAYLKDEAGKRRLILGIDRLDYSKGLPYKLAAFRRALIRHRGLRKRVTLVQHVVPSREDVPEYRRLRLEIERTVSEINGRFSTPGWVPVHYFYHSLDADELCAYYRVADIALITPLKDGMNLVAKEYCSCRVDGDGVLILSEFAGAVDELRFGALVVNPFDVEGVAAAIHRAFFMDQDEQHSRMRRLRQVVRENDVYRWVESYLGWQPDSLETLGHDPLDDSVRDAREGVANVGG